VQQGNSGAAKFASFEEIGFDPESASRYYEFTLERADADGFVAVATGKGDVAKDLWRVDQAGKVQSIVDSCATQ